MKKIWNSRIEDVRNILLKDGLDGILFSLSENVAWLTFGMRNHITLNTTEGVASILVTDSKVFLITDNIEMKRLCAEEIPSEIIDDINLIEYNWWDGEYSSIERYFKNMKLASDTGRYGYLNVEKEISPLRMVLSSVEVSNYEFLGKICDEILYEVMSSITQLDREIELQGRISKKFFSLGIEPILALVFGEKSSMEYRHNLPRNLEIGKKCFASVCVRNRGLIASSTRSICFERDEKLIEQHKMNCIIDSYAINDSNPGRRICDVFDTIIEAYRINGYDGEWKKHHQGGTAGYKSREIVADMANTSVIPSSCAVAWNPTITGTKSEDTVLVSDDEKKIATFPEKSMWPAISVKIDKNVFRRPDLMIL